MGGDVGVVRIRAVVLYEVGIEVVELESLSGGGGKVSNHIKGQTTAHDTNVRQHRVQRIDMPG